MKPERAADEAAAVRATPAPQGPGTEAVAAATVARVARRGGAATPAGVRALHRAAGNAAVGRLLGREPAVSPSARGDLIDPFGLTEEDWAQIERDAATARIELREQALAPLDQRVPFGFLARLRDLQPGQRGILLADQEFWKRVNARLSGTARWAVKLALQFGHRAPPEVNALHAAVHEANWKRIRELIMAYPSLRAVEGLREVVGHKLTARQAEDIFAVLAEAGTRAESGRRDYREVHYKAGVLTEFQGTRNYELVRLTTQLRVIVRIKLRNDPANAGNAISDTSVARWEGGINRRWNGKFRLRSGASTLDVWFLPIFVYHDDAAHHTIDVRPGDETSNQHLWYEDDSADTAAHEFGHMIGNPDEYNLPGSLAEIPATLGLSDAERRRSSWEGLTGKPAEQKDAGHDMHNLMGEHSIDASLRVRHGWDVLDVFNAKLRKPGEDPWTIELK